MPVTELHTSQQSTAHFQLNAVFCTCPMLGNTLLQTKMSKNIVYKDRSIIIIMSGKSLNKFNIFCLHDALFQALQIPYACYCPQNSSTCNHPHLKKNILIIRSQVHNGSFQKSKVKTETSYVTLSAVSSHGIGRFPMLFAG